MISVPSRVLCLVAHPDDLEPQAGGTVTRLVNSGARVHILNAITPNINIHGQVIAGARRRRMEEGRMAATILGASVDFLDIDPNDLRHSQHTVQRFDNLTREFDPDLIISHHEVDTQQDHVNVAKIAQTIGRRNRITIWHLSHSFPGGYLAHRPQPNLFVDVTSVYSTKTQALLAYESQRDRYNGLIEENWIQIIEARDRYYGGMLNQDGLDSTVYAEGFVVGKMVWTE